MSLDSDLPVVSDDPFWNDLAYTLVGTETILRKMVCAPDQVGNQKKSIMSAAQRRYALLDETVYCELYRPGLDWMCVEDLANSMSVRLCGSMLEDIRHLRANGMLLGRWILHDLPDTRTLSVSVVRLREALLKNPRLSSMGELERIAQLSQRSVSSMINLVERTTVVSYEVSLTPAGYRVVANGW